ncbi:MAG: M13 family metallopeptidase [Erysipelotrichaceae bacterium]|nr:M13 family metallopeptidase [Erysipelotrichaceae bacterium]
MSNIRIQDDLYEYVNGDFIEKAIIPDDKPLTGGFMDLSDEVERKLMEDFEAFGNGEKVCEVKEVNDAIKLYRKVLDTERRNNEGIKPVKPMLDEIRDIKTIDDLNRKAKELMLNGVSMPVNFGVEADMKDAANNCFVILGPSIILPDTSYYGNEKGNQLLAVYKDMALKILSYTDLSEDEKNLYIEDTLKFDELISKEVKSQLEWADYVKNYNPMDSKEVYEYLKPFDMEGMLKEVYGDKTPDTMIAYDPKAIKNMKNYFNEDTFEMYVHWAYVKTLISATENLSIDLWHMGTAYRRAIMGIEKDSDLDKTAYRKASGTFSEPLGIYYGRTYFGEEAKKDITEMVKKIIETYKKRVKENTFLEESTKEKAIKKLSTIVIKMGYPDEVSKLYKKIKVDDNDSLYETCRKIGVIRNMDNLEKLHKPVERKEWMMPGHMVNACYDPSRNDITFPAAILQKPFYSLNQSESENLGGIGVVIAHEISHAFDNNGSHFDENGNLNDWWTKKDFENFERQTKDMIEEWDGIEYCGEKLNGEMVVSENIADNGGMAVTLQIMHESGNEDFKNYFINYARIWCQKSRDEYKKFLLSVDCHSPAKLRVNIQVRNFEEWYETFDVKDSDEMYIPLDKRIIVW